MPLSRHPRVANALQRALRRHQKLPERQLRLLADGLRFVKDGTERAAASFLSLSVLVVLF